MAKFVEFLNHVVVVNTTPHDVVMQDMDGLIVTVPPCGSLVNASAKEMPIDETGLFVRTVFTGTMDGERVIKKLNEQFNRLNYPKGYRLVILGSMIAAHAYPGKVFAMTPVPGFERVPSAEKRMRCDKFTTYA